MDHGVLYINVHIPSVHINAGLVKPEVEIQKIFISQLQKVIKYVIKRRVF